MSKVIIREIKSHQDNRGLLFEPAGPEELAGQKNIHAVLTEPGAIRGNHLHQHATEITAILGPALARFREEGKIWEVSIPAGAVHQFTIPPGISHAFQNTGHRTMVLVSFNSSAFNPEQPDVQRDVLI